MRSSVSRGTEPAPLFHLKNVDRAGAPSRVRCSSTESCQASAIRKKVRSAGPASDSSSAAGRRGAMRLAARAICYLHMDSHLILVHMETSVKLSQTLLH